MAQTYGAGELDKFEEFYQNGESGRIYAKGGSTGFELQAGSWVETDLSGTDFGQANSVTKFSKDEIKDIIAASA